MIHPNRKPSQKGFTLVEVIVVAVIVAAMAAVAVPMYLTYVTNARINAAANAAGSIAAWAGACLNTGGALPAWGVLTGVATCTNVAQGNTQITIPSDITVNLVENPRSVTARHTASDATDANTLKTYRF